jgi:multidrug efflux pump
VRVRDVANVVESAENVKLGAWAGVDGTLKPAIILNVQRQPGANVIATVDAIKQRLPELTAGLPAAMKVEVLTDRTTGIRASVKHVQIELLLAVVLVVLVIFAFLHSVRATVIASLAVPISLIGTLGVMYLLGYSLNNLSLMALTIATGFVVDDAIVMIENISRYIEEGEPPLQAAMKGAAQIGFTIISLTVSLIAVLIPLLFMGDVVGRLFREFAVTLAITILISAWCRLTLVPMMSARWLTAHPGGETGWGGRLQKRFDAVIARYDIWLGWVLARQGLTLLVAAATLALTVLLYIMIPKGLFPTQDTGQLQARVETAQSVSYARMAELQQAVAREVLADPDVESLSSYIGVDAANNTMLHTGRLLINLTDSAGDQQDIMNRLRERVRGMAGVTLYLQPTQDLTIDSESGPTQYRVSLESADTATVTQWATRLAERLQQVDAVRNVVSDADAIGRISLCEPGPRHGSAPVDHRVGGGRGAVQRIRPAHRVHHLYRDQPVPRDPGGAARCQRHARVAGPWCSCAPAAGSPTPLSAVATITERRRRCRSRTWRSTRPPRWALTPRPACRWARGRCGPPGGQRHRLPASVTMTFLGASGAYEASLSNQLWLILAAIVCVYIVLGVLYESYIHPLTILSTLPSAGVGALLMLMVTGNDLGVIGIIGIILLIGIVKKNAIMMIDFAIDAERNEGKSAAGRHPPGRAAALSPHPHDHAGRAVCRRAADAGLGRGGRAAPAAGPGDLWRAGSQPAADAVHDAGDLSGV